MRAGWFVHTTLAIRVSRLTVMMLIMRLNFSHVNIYAPQLSLRMIISVR